MFLSFYENITENQITILSYIKSLAENCMKAEGGKTKRDYVIKHNNQEKKLYPIFVILLNRMADSWCYLLREVRE